MAIENSYNFRRVNDTLTTSGVVGPNRLKGLRSEGYEVLVNLLPNTSEYAIPNEKAIVELQGVEYVYIPVDFRQPKLSDFEEFAAALDNGLGKKVHIHCAANYRVSAFYSLYATRHGLWNEIEAKEFVQGLWEPQAFPGWSKFIMEVEGQGIGSPN